MNILINNRKCPNCNNTFKKGVFSDYFTWDSHHDLLYCNQCGLVVINNEIPDIEYLEYCIKLDEKPKPKKKDKPKNHNPFVTALNSFLDGIEKEKELKRMRAKERRQKKKKSQKRSIR